MKKLVLSVFVIVSFLLYSFGLRNSDSLLLVSPKASGGSGGQGEGEDDGQVSPNSSSTPSSTPNSTQTVGAYKDGAYSGSVADAFYGNIQVQVTIKGGRITAVKFLQYPNDQPNSIAINQQAMPYLQQEAIQAQSPNVNGVSGATDTSQAFVQSLSSALRQAGM